MVCVRPESYFGNGFGVPDAAAGAVPAVIPKKLILARPLVGANYDAGVRKAYGLPVNEILDEI